MFATLSDRLHHARSQTPTPCPPTGCTTQSATPSVGSSRCHPGTTNAPTTAVGAATLENTYRFDAGGAGITPFLSILRERRSANELQGCHLIFSNRTEADIICRRELESMDGLDLTLLITGQPDSPLASDELDRDALAALIDDVDRPFYVCGPPAMTEAIGDALEGLGGEPDAVTLDDQV